MNYDYVHCVQNNGRQCLPYDCCLQTDYSKPINIAADTRTFTAPAFIVSTPPRAMKVYLVGSMRNPKVPATAKILRTEGFDVFDDWYSPGPEADEFWNTYEKDRGRTYKEALDGTHAWNVYEYDKRNIDASDAVVLVQPAGRSAHMELGYAKGQGKRAFVLFEEEPERWDVMYRFADAVCFSVEELIGELRRV